MHKVLSLPQILVLTLCNHTPIHTDTHSPTHMSTYITSTVNRTFMTLTYICSFIILLISNKRQEPLFPFICSIIILVISNKRQEALLPFTCKIFWDTMGAFIWSPHLGHTFRKWWSIFNSNSTYYILFRLMIYFWAYNIWLKEHSSKFFFNPTLFIMSDRSVTSYPSIEK